MNITIAVVYCSNSQDDQNNTVQVELYGGTVKPVLNGHSKIDKTKNLMTNGSVMKVESIAECSLWSILQYF